MTKISKNPWKDLLDNLIRLFPDKQVDCQFLKEGLYIFIPNMEVHIPYPKVAKFPEGKMNLHHLHTIISLLEKPSLNVFRSSGKLILKEDSLSIDIPHSSIPDKSNYIQNVKNLYQVQSNNLMDILKGVTGPLKRSKSGGIAENVYWSKTTLYSYNGVVLSTYSGVPTLSPKSTIIIPKNIVLFLNSFENDEIISYVSVLADNSVDITLIEEDTETEIVSIRFTQPDVSVPIWEEFVPTIPKGWMPIPKMFFRLSDVAVDLAYVYNSQIELEWNNLTIKASSTPQYCVAFQFLESTPFPNMKKGLLDILYIKPILEYSEQMGWEGNHVVFSGGKYKFFMAVE